MRTSSSSYVWCIYVKYSIIMSFSIFMKISSTSSSTFLPYASQDFSTILIPPNGIIALLEDYQFEVLLYLLNLYQYNQPHEKQQLILFLYLYQELHLLNRVLFCKDQELRSKAFLFFLLFLLRKNYLPHKAYNSFE